VFERQAAIVFLQKRSKFGSSILPAIYRICTWASAVVSTAQVLTLPANTAWPEGLRGSFVSRAGILEMAAG